MSMSYSVIFLNSQVKEADKRAAENVFCGAVEALLGGESDVADAYRDYMAAFDAFGKLPLPPEASDAQRAAVRNWELAEGAGYQAASKWWRHWPDGAHFEVTLG